MQAVYTHLLLACRQDPALKAALMEDSIVFIPEGLETVSRFAHHMTPSVTCIASSDQVHLPASRPRDVLRGWPTVRRGGLSGVWRGWVGGLPPPPPLGVAYFLRLGSKMNGCAAEV